MDKALPGSPTFEENPFTSALKRDLHINQRKGPLTVSKTADETVNNSTTLQNDDELLFAIKANETWAFEMFLPFTCENNTPDIKFAITVPASATLYWILVYMNTTKVEDTSGNAEWVEGANGLRIASITGVVINSSTAGNVQLQWAQDTADASDTILKTGSYILAHQLK